MGAIASLLGVQPQQAALLNPVTAPQANAANATATGGVDQQQAFVNALGAQGGLGNQANVFGQQQALAGQLGQMAQGGGPNPALAQLAQSTGQNNANTAALMAGQRGGAANAGLIARQAGQQGAADQQQAAGQAATLRAQQQLAAIQQLQQQQQMLGGLATQQVGQQQQGLAGLNQFAQGNQQNILGGIANQNNANASMQGNINNANVASIKPIGDIVGGVGSSVAAMAQGGEVADCANQSGNFKEMDTEDHHVVKYFLEGGSVGGKAKKPGDSAANDTVPAMLSPGEIVVPRSAAQDPEKAASFAKSVAMRSKRK